MTTSTRNLPPADSSRPRATSSIANLLLLCALCCLLFTGCIPILVHAGVQSAAQEKAAYSAYLDTQAKINSDRELANLPPHPVLTRAEWRQTVNRTNSPALTPWRAP